ncbi:MAG: N-6 DNA methylase, partial [Leptolyngbyaceae cyanobacterium CRU_2_3]|nr:N-6 DNA methylase [Leptolyngbyaceae cyanobacterium CRU_2_3]
LPPKKSASQKAGGIYYTPKAIVTYILQNSLSRLLPCSGALALLDPACGSGVFLLLAYQFLLDWYLQVYLTQDLQQSLKKHWIEQSQDGVWHLSGAARSRILLNHIYGVDIDPQAIAITKLALGFKCLEQSDHSACPLPDLSRNIQCGNALIGSDFIKTGLGKTITRSHHVLGLGASLSRNYPIRRV